MDSLGETLFDEELRVTASGDLLDIVTSQAGPDQVVEWLESVAGATAHVTQDDIPEDAPHLPPADVLAALTEGRQRQPYLYGPRPSEDEDSTSKAGWLLVVGCGDQPPPTRRLLLWTWRPHPWDQDARQDALRAAAAIHTLSAAADIAVREAAVSTAAMATRLAALRPILAGELPKAAAEVDALVPGLGASGAGQIAVLETDPEDRARLILDLDRTLHWSALVVSCIETTTQVVVVRAGDGLGQAIREATLARPSRTAGVSLPTPWPRAGAGYAAALAALTTARHAGPDADPVALHDGRTPMVERLGADARLWAAGLLAPLDVLPPAEREQLLATAGEVLWWGTVSAARVMGWSKRTAIRHMDRVATLTGLDLADWRHRVVLHAAIRLDALPPPPPLSVRRLTLEAALDHPAARDWAADVLAPLTTAQRHTAVTWMSCGRQPAEAASALKISRSMLYKRLATIAAATQVPITVYPGPAADLALALATVGDLDLGPLPTRTPHPRPQTPPQATDEAAIDIRRAHPARVYGYYTGGTVHFSADRQAAVQIQQSVADTAAAAQGTHQFIARAVEAAAALGVRQVLDLASGIPTAPAPHHLMQRHHPAARVLYLSPDPVVRAHSARLLHGTPPARTSYADGALTDGATLYTRPQVRDVLDLQQPVLVIDANTHFVTDDELARKLLHELMGPLAPGSYLALACLTADHAPDTAAQIVAEATRTIAPITTRTRTQVAALLDGLQILQPGITAAGDWRPDPSAPYLRPSRVHSWVALARRTHPHRQPAAGTPTSGGVSPEPAGSDWPQGVSGGR